MQFKFSVGVEISTRTFVHVRKVTLRIVGVEKDFLRCSVNLKVN